MGALFVIRYWFQYMAMAVRCVSVGKVDVFVRVALCRVMPACLSLYVG